MVKISSKVAILQEIEYFDENFENKTLPVGQVGEITPTCVKDNKYRVNFFHRPTIDFAEHDTFITLYLVQDDFIVLNFQNIINQDPSNIRVDSTVDSEESKIIENYIEPYLGNFGTIDSESFEKKFKPGSLVTVLSDFLEKKDGINKIPIHTGDIGIILNP